MAKLSYLTIRQARPWVVPLGLLAVMMLLGAALFRGFGIGWDEFRIITSAT